MGLDEPRPNEKLNLMGLHGLEPSFELHLTILHKPRPIIEPNHASLKGF
jgi:hypothetical protein